MTEEIKDEMTNLEDEQLDGTAGGATYQISSALKREIWARRDEWKAKGYTRQQAAEEFVASIPRTHLDYGVRVEAVYDYMRSCY